MTPERIEEIKNVAGISDEWALEKIVNELLATLEESQQQVVETKGYLRIKQNQVWELSAERDATQKELAEAQQTIARAITIYETADMESDFDNVLTGMYEVLKGTEGKS